MAETIKIKTRKGYTVLQNDLILYHRLSLKTKGLMAVMLSRPDGWEFSVSGLAAFCNCGKDTIRGALKELEAAGYLTRQQLHGPGGSFAGNLYEIHEGSLDPPPPSPSSDFPTTEKPSSGKPSSGKPSSGKLSSGNPTQRNKDLKNTPLPPKGERSVSMPKWKPEAFERWWTYYRKHGRGENRAGAVKAWDRLKPDDDLIRTMGQALMAQVKGEQWRRGVGVPYASTWLNNRRWEDKLLPVGQSEDDGPLRVEDRGLPVWK